MKILGFVVGIFSLVAGAFFSTYEMTKDRIWYDRILHLLAGISLGYLLFN